MELFFANHVYLYKRIEEAFYMSFFKKALASFGVGNAQVDTVLDNSTFRAGDTLTGRVEVKGGDVAQNIDAISLLLYTTYTKELNDSKFEDEVVLERLQVSQPFTINAKEYKEIPFSLTLPYETPITMGKTRVWVHTGLDIAMAIDPTDKDFISVEPSILVTEVLNAVQALGFRLREVACEAAPARYRNRYPFVQEFEFVPTSGHFRGRLDELEVMFLSQSAHSVELLLQIDRKVRGLSSLFAEALDMDESFVRLSVSSQDIPSLTTKLQQLLSKHA